MGTVGKIGKNCKCIILMPIVEVFQRRLGPAVSGVEGGGNPLT